MKGLSSLGAALLLAGCANVVMNDGSTVVVEWDSTLGSKQDALETATRSCQGLGKKAAIEVTDVSSNPNLPGWMTSRKTSFRCE